MNKKIILGIHFMSLILIMIYLNLSYYKIPLLFRIITLGIFIPAYILTFVPISISFKDAFLSGKMYWYISLIFSAVFIALLSSDILVSNIIDEIKYIIVIILILFLTTIFIWTSKKKFSNRIHIINIMILSTYIILNLSNTFSYYYSLTYGIDLPSNYGRNIIYRILSNGKISLRYFFEFPPDEYYDFVTFIQFIIGRVYEAIILGGVVGVVSGFLGNSKKDE